MFNRITVSLKQHQLCCFSAKRKINHIQHNDNVNCLRVNLKNLGSKVNVKLNRIFSFQYLCDSRTKFRFFS